MKKHLWLAAAALLVSACASNQPAPSAPATAESAHQAIAAAEAAVKQADSVGFAWRDSEKMITAAKEAAQKQDFATAVKLANTAEKQGKLAFQQSQDQKNVAAR
jgi:uncharacterized protein (DUF58 family)